VAAEHDGGRGTSGDVSRHAVLWAWKSVVIDRVSIARVAASLGVSWRR